MERREFLKAGVAGLSSSFVLGGLTAGFPRSAQAANIVIDFSVEEVMKIVPVNRAILTWQYVNALQPGPGALNSGIVVTEGDTVTINIQNNLTSNYPVNLVCPGLLDTSVAAAPGGSQSYTFVATTPGSYLYYDDNNGDLGRAMGLMGPLVVKPMDGSQALTPIEFDPNNFDREYTIVTHEIDSRINDAMAAGLPFDLNTYQPDYFFANGLSYPETVQDAAGNIDDTKVILMSTGQNVALRLINGGLIYYPMHFHGYHVNVVTRNRMLEENVVEKDTVLVKEGEAVEAILPVGDQVGLYPLHTHYIPGVTTSGFYAGGSLLMMKSVLGV